MINSMTGYGQAQGQLEGISFAVEIKTVNNRYFKASIKLPELVSFLEDEIEKLLRANLARGSVSYVLRLKDVSADVLFDINQVALQRIVEKLSNVRTVAGISGTIDLSKLLELPGIIQPAQPDEQTAARIREKVLQVSAEALEKVKQMRMAEGRALQADLAGHCDAIRADLERIRQRSGVVVGEYARRLKKRVEELLAYAELKLDEDLLAREVAVFADRSDISEELARLDSHLEQFERGCQGDGQVGRRLDFISQELLREVNTIASKACDSEITRCVVDMKCRIDRIKEQVQNVE